MPDHPASQPVPAGTLRADIFHADAELVLRRQPADSIHAVVTDPPYGLTSDTPIRELLQAWLAGDDFINSHDGYGGKDWDNSVPSPRLWRSAHRAMVPGGFLLAFAASRTAHLTAVALQLAGFEVRDTIHWVYSPGRPTSLDLVKQARNLDDPQAVQRLAGRRATLRPGHEPIVVARKPLAATTTLENILDLGVGGIGLTGLDQPMATNVMHVHDLTCTATTCDCGLAEHPGREHATQLYPSTSLPHAAVSVPKPGASERPRSADGTAHPTVKPLLLMRQLIRAVTEPGHTVFDPFLGSGTTAEAALLEGRNAAGCEANADYLPLIAQRLARSRAELTD